MCLPSIKDLRVRVCIIHILFEWESFEEMATGRAEIYLIRLRGQTSPMIAGASTQNPVTYCLETWYIIASSLHAPTILQIFKFLLLFNIFQKRTSIFDKMKKHNSSQVQMHMRYSFRYGYLSV